MSSNPTIEGESMFTAPDPPSLGGELQRKAIRQRLFGESQETKIGRYRIVEKLGEGGMGIVYSAVDDDLDREVALKVLRTDDERLAKRLQREARSMAKLNHPNVVMVHEVTEIDDQLCVAMEFVAGQTLGDWLKNSPRLEDVLDVFAQAARGLHAAHEAGIIHRDFKPDNVLVGNDDRVRVLDFGLAKAAPGAVDLASVDLERLTATGALIGTPRYMAPEQFEAKATDARTDQFSFCVALYEAVFGAPPFDGPDLPTIGLKVTQGKVSPPPAGHQVPRTLVRAIMRGLEVDPSGRHESMLGLLRILENRDPAPAPGPFAGRSAKLVVGIFAGVLMSALLVALVMLGQ